MTNMNSELKIIVNCVEQGDFESAEKALDSLAPSHQDDVFTTYLRAIVYGQRSRFDDAIAAFRICCTSASPEEWWTNFGVCAKNAGDWPSLSRVAQELMKRNSSEPQAVLVRIEASRRGCRFDDALSLAQRLHANTPDSFRARLILANALKDLRRYDEATDAFKRALELEPHNEEARWNLTLNELASRASELGLENFERRFEKSTPPFLEYAPQDVPRVTKHGPRQDKLLIISEQGFGDTLQFARYAASICQRHKGACWVAPKRLTKLLSASFPMIRFIAKSDIVEEEWDQWMPLMSAPYLGYTESTNPYLNAPPIELRTELHDLVRGKVMLNWFGSSTYIHDYWRSLDTSNIRSFIEQLGPRQVVSIQHGLTDDLRNLLPEGTREIGDSLDQGPDGFCETAVLLRSAKALVTTDTAIAHLAGGLGIPTHLILGPVADWRWERDEESTPWYPTMTLHRWTTFEHLPALMNRVAELLA